ncbi:inosine/uridine-preferring nucleoside hydrolase [Pleomassaria siparia CBS 279.74]|uniref:Inosine/uridine-preferring nucleoside hydrolase n=1 Tax=Pleomassaria siparia CBS 279.74 TaxID=1314801 RepID=A0A6G1KGR4_9PLEO|nr:inosine/uridine-preferring nucleoside hydrolase [Pleomassaria siparia CBS 279.74]
MASFLDAILAPRRVLHNAVAYLSLYASATHALAGKGIIVDTDLFSDVDDAAALLLAATLPNTTLLAVNVNVNSTYSALAASAILNHYGYPTVPIGLPRPYINSSFFDTWAFELGEYASKVAYHWSAGSVPWFGVEKTWEPVELYRKTLAEAADGSVTIASIGFFENLSGLLNSTADRYSNLTGSALVEKKVKELVIMGGGYPSGHEFNFWGDNPLATAHVVNTWPKSIALTFLGTEVGEMVFSGAKLTLLGPTNDPVKAAYNWYVGYNTTRFSWDPLTVAYACQGLGTWFEYGNVEGYNYVYPNGSNVWREDKTRTNQHYLKLKAGNDTVARELDELYLAGARMWE